MEVVRRSMPGWWKTLITVLACVMLALAATAHEAGRETPVVVIDTDVGLDDVVTLALALQDPDLQLAAVVACEGVAGRVAGVASLERMLHRFNRRDVPLYGPADGAETRPAPAFRCFAEAAVRGALPEETPPSHQPFSPEAYLHPEHHTVVVALGPLTNLAAAVAARPDLGRYVDRVVVAGDPGPDPSWNLAFDPAGAETVLASGLSVVFVTPGDGGDKPDRWHATGLGVSRGTSLAEAFLGQLLADPEVHGHYLRMRFCDEMAFLFVKRPELFVPGGAGNEVAARDLAGAVQFFESFLGRGRQRKDRVVFVDGLFPSSVLRDDVRLRREAIIAANGEDEWFAQLLVSELHEHLGAYSVIGVKMGLRAAELLNAPQHAMEIVSAVPEGPPTSCLDDGLLVATGSTPGRGLFHHAPGTPGTVRASFSYNGRRVVLELRDSYRQRIRSEIEGLLAAHTLDEPEYWAGVRRLGLEIWEHWHRRDLFDVVVLEDEPSAPPQAWGGGEP